MHSPFGLPRLGSGRSVLAAFVLLLGLGAAEALAGDDGGRLLPRARSDPVTLPIHTLFLDHRSYYTVIKAGGLNFRVVLDTASADLWLLSTDCETDLCKKLPRYPLTFQSPTFVSLDNNATAFNAEYADGTCACLGLVAAETIEAANLTLSNQTFGVITNSNVSLVDQSAIDSAIVANDSLIGWNKVAEFPPFSSESNVSSYLQWAIPMTGITVNGSQSELLALFDIGAPGIYGPYQDFSGVRMYAMIDGARMVDTDGQWVVPCDTAIPMTFTFGQRNYTILPTDYIIGPASGNPNLCLSWPMSLPPSSDGIDWQMGTAFLRTPNIDTRLRLSFISANSQTVATTLPNFLLPTPSFTTPPYTFNTSVSTTLGGIVSSDLANSTYSALFGQKTTLSNISALPMITPPPSIVTLVVTDAVGASRRPLHLSQ
ncbi:aspartic peptidase A1 [Pholiota molesta]|nr:aspartic peptidase A1 [Pholiota molesta]